MNRALLLPVTIGILLLATSAFGLSDPQITSWLTTYSGQYARLYETDAALAVNNPVTTWSRGGTTQSLPTYCGVHEVAFSTDWVYIRSTGLGSHVMGPWYLNVARTTLFPNLPINRAVLYRFPRNPTVPAGKTLTGLGPIGYFVDGVSAFDSRDAFSYNSGSGNPGTEANPGSGYWNRDAYVNESVTFDPALAHQPGSGQYHYHANPAALRYLLGDNVVFDPLTKVYTEDTSNPTPLHSPILGWMRDGFPIYGPYGYSDPNNPASGVRRIISGYVPRNIAAPGVADRSTYPLWAVRVTGLGSTNLTTQAGPPVSVQRPFGRYMEDNDYLGDLGFTLGIDFDLNEQNARFCVTPEFPAGTWAYFVCISSNGAPVFPYNIGRQFFGNPTGNNIMSGVYPETVTTNFAGGSKMPLEMEAPSIGSPAPDVTLTWSAVDGGTYVIETTPDFASWNPIGTNSPVAQTNVPVPITRRSYVDPLAALPGVTNRFYRVERTNLAPYDSNGFTP